MIKPIGYIFMLPLFIFATLLYSFAMAILFITGDRVGTKGIIKNIKSIWKAI